MPKEIKQLEIDIACLRLYAHNSTMLDSDLVHRVVIVRKSDCFYMRRTKIEGVARILGGLESTAAISENTTATIGALWETMAPNCNAGAGISSPELLAKNGCCGAQVCGVSRGALWCGQCECGAASAGWAQFPMAQSATHCALSATNEINRRIANLIPARCMLFRIVAQGGI
jgi:hypothetical protein